jgi:hypothetical protein
MPAAQATISTSRAAAYLTRLCGHAAKMSTATRRLHHRPRDHAGGAPPQVRIRAQAPEQGSLQRIQDLLTARLLTLARREQLTITWHPAPDPEEPGQPG